MESGIVLYRGPSKFDGSEILVVAVWRSKNTKTGNMIQVFILPAVAVAIATRPHASNCAPDCPFIGGGCYINWSQAPLMVQTTYADKPVSSPADVRAFVTGRLVRIGAAGDPGAVPARVWRNVAGAADGWTGYTHDWRRARSRHLSSLCMASVESPDDSRAATRKGWRTFRVRPRDTATMGRPFEIDCPAASGVQCLECMLCAGTGNGREAAPSITIPAHGGAVAGRLSNRIAVGVN